MPPTTAPPVDLAVRGNGHGVVLPTFRDPGEPPGWLSEDGEDLALPWPVAPQPAKRPLPKSTPAPTQDGASWAAMRELIGPVVWTWPGWLPAGLLTELVGESGSGKSAVALRIAKPFLSGTPWPDDTLYTGETGKVLWCEAEAAQAINLERAQAWRLPCDAILSPLDDPLTDLDLYNVDHQAALQRAANRLDVRLIVVDSLSGASGGKEKGDEMMPIVKLLAELARNTGKPVLLLHHLRKRGLFDNGDTITLDRVRGSTVIVQPARVVWAVDTPNPAEPNRRRLSVIKSNLGRFPQAIGLTIDDAGVTFGDAPEAPKTETQLDRAAELLVAILRKGPTLYGEIETEAAGAGLSMDTVRRAKEKLGVVTKRDGKAGKWSWALPAHI